MHDRNGKPLKVGDKVNLPATIRELGDPTSGYCNVGIVTDVPMGDRTEGDKYQVNAKMVELVESAPAPEPDPHAGSCTR